MSSAPHDVAVPAIERSHRLPVSGGEAGDGSRTRMASLEGRAAIKGLTWVNGDLWVHGDR
jgi:hypothetical protein